MVSNWLVSMLSEITKIRATELIYDQKLFDACSSVIQKDIGFKEACQEIG